MSPKNSKKTSKPATDATDWGFVSDILGSQTARTVYLWGPPGTGKTFTANREGRGDRDVFSVTLTPETPAAELRGFWMPKGQDFAWSDGVFVDAMRRGARIVLNEVSYASHDMLAMLHPVLENEQTARITLPNLETVFPAPGFQVVCTDNLPPDQLPEALRDRFKSVLRVDRPHPEALAALPDDLREAALRTFDLESARAVSVRGWLAVAEFEREFSRPKAFEAVFGRERGEQLLNAFVLGNA